MPNPFSSEYASSSLTDTSVAATKFPDTKRDIPQAATIDPLDDVTGSSTFGFEPERYGLGKPKRIVIRGKITRE